MEKQGLKDSNVLWVSHRTRVLEQLLEGEGIPEKERRFLRMATQQVETWSPTVASVYSARLLTRALEEHSHALTQAAEASDRHAKALVFVTAVLALATIGLLLSPLLLSP